VRCTGREKGGSGQPGLVWVPGTAPLALKTCSPHRRRDPPRTGVVPSRRDAPEGASYRDSGSPPLGWQYDRARGNLDRHGVHFLTAYVAGV
jgi:hypothetical protein